MQEIIEKKITTPVFFCKHIIYKLKERFGSLLVDGSDERN